MIGMSVLYLPIKGFEYFHNDAHKREFISCGLSCGIATAFGAPIGGTLFGFEISRPNTFWEVRSTWRTMLSCCIAVIVFSLMRDIFRPRHISNWVLNTSALKFEDTTYPQPTIGSLPPALFIGIFCGMIGAFFVYMNTLVNMFRKEYMSSPFFRVVEVTLLAFVTTSFAYWLPYVVYAQCFTEEVTNGGNSGNEKDWKFLVQYNCPTGYFNPLATLFMNTESTVIKSIVTGFTYGDSANNYLYSSAIGTYALFWMFFSIMTYGSSVPSGCFLFAIIVGAGVGQIWENTRINILGIASGEYSTLPLVIGAASMIASTTRMSYSIVVLMLEAANAFNLAIPMIIAVFTAKLTGDLLTNSLYEREIRECNLPVLTGSCPPRNRDKKAAEIMGKDPITVTTIAEMRQIQRALDSEHNGFPVLNTAGHLVGLIPKNMLLVLTEQKVWYNTRRLSIASRTRAKQERSKLRDFDSAKTLLEKLEILNEQNEKFDVNFDEGEGFPHTPKEEIISKINFNSDITG